MRKSEVERTIGSGTRKSDASLLCGGPGWLGPFTNTLVIAEGCERTASATSPLTVREMDERVSRCSEGEGNDLLFFQTSGTR